MRDILKFMDATVDGRGYAGVCKKVEAPKIEVATREMKAGMAGPINIRMGRLKSVMKMKLTFEGMPPELYEQLDLTEGGTFPITLRGSAEDGDGTTHGHKIVARCIVESLDEGTWEDGEDVPLTLECSLRYYERWRDGVELWAVDPENMVFRQNGRDMLADHRRNLAR